MKLIKSLLIVSVLTTTVLTAVSAQNAVKIDINDKYKFPLAIGVSWKSMSPSPELGTDFGAEYIYTDLSAAAYFPLESMPTLQPFAGLGLISFTGVEPSDISTNPNYNILDNTQLYFQAGSRLTDQLLSKQLEIGGSNRSAGTFPGLLC